MKFIIVAVIIAILVIAIIVLRNRKRDLEYNELKETIHNSGIIKELNEHLRLLIMYHDMDWSHEQIDYYDDCDRLIIVFNSCIDFAIWKNQDWQPMFHIDFVNDLGYKPLLDNGLNDGKKYITNEDIYRVFMYEVVEIVKKLFNNDEIQYDSFPKYSNGFERQQQPDGSYKSIRIGDEQASIRYKVPKSIGAKQI